MLGSKDLSLSTSKHPSTRSLTAMSVNVGMGAVGQFEDLLAVLSSNPVDILCLQECIGWDNPDVLHRLGVAVGLSPDHVHLGDGRVRPSGNSYPVIIVSRLPIDEFTVFADPAVQGHALLEGRILLDGSPLWVWGTHFDHYAEDLRVREAEFIAERVSVRLRDAGDSGLLLGDLNALHPHDRRWRDVSPAMNAVGWTKYGLPPRTDAMQILLSAGFVDTFHSVGLFDPVTVTRQVGGQAFELRTDYIMSNGPLALTVKSAEVIGSMGTSDHDFVRAEWSFPVTPS